ncbi:MAG: hypothetical protein ABI175_09250 [Polyangiales bacterium]
MRLASRFAALLLGVVPACGGDSPATRSIHALLLPECSVDDVQRIELEALDDLATRPASFAEVDPRGSTELVALPPAARIILARGRSKDGVVVSLGVLRADADGGPAAGALFHDGRACGIPLSDGSAAQFPPFIHPAIGATDRYALLAGGRGADGSGRAEAIFIDGSRTEATRLSAGMLHRRDYAVVLPLGATLLVAGGRDDDHFWSDFEVLDTATRPLAFDRRALSLSEVRVESAGVVLTSGDGLLIGGMSNDGKALRSMEVIDARTFTTRIVDVATLGAARRGPSAARLATGDIAVVGGRDGPGAPVPDVEILTADARAARAIAFGAHASLDAIALPSGALLIASTDPPLATIDLWLVRLDGTVEALASAPAGGRAPRWLPGTDGAPFLWDGIFRRFDPWNATLVDAQLPIALVPDPDIDPFVPTPGVIATARIVDGRLSFLATRYDVRTELTTDETLGLGSTAHLSPDRHDGIVVNRSGIELPGGARLAITDVTFAAFTLRLGGGGRELPDVELRDEQGALVTRIGEGALAGCAWPPGLAETTAEVVRSETGAIEVRVGKVSVVCAPPTAALRRVSITLVASSSAASIHGITVSRGG